MLRLTQADLDAQVQHCLAVTDDDMALECLLEAVRPEPEEQGLCRPQVVLLTRLGCPGCEEERQAKRAALESGGISEVDIDSERGRRLASLNEITSTPAILILDCQDNPIEEKRADVGDASSGRLDVFLDEA